jgi:hypothetical protein
MTADIESPVRRNLDLLARVQYCGATGKIGQCFASIVELGNASLTLECSQELSTGDLLVLSVVFPNVQRKRNIASLNCVVHSVVDAANLRYHVTITQPDSDTRRQIDEYLRRPEAQNAGAQARA